MSFPISLPPLTHAIQTKPCRVQRWAEVEARAHSFPLTLAIPRLSESNLPSISAQMEELYMAHSRRDMNTTLTDALLRACAPDTPTPSRLLMEHVLLVSILHCTVGIEVNAQFPAQVLVHLRVVALCGGGGVGGVSLRKQI